MYQCDECKRVFKTPRKISAESFYGVSSDFIDSKSTIDVCPYCDGTFTEVVLCEKCGELILYGDIHECEGGEDNE